MSITRITVKNFKSIKICDISLSKINLFIGENGTGKTNLLEAINYFYRNLSASDIRTDIFDENNHYSNEVKISISFDLSEFVKISKSNTGNFFDLLNIKSSSEKKRYAGYYKEILDMAYNNSDKIFCVELSQIKGKAIRWNYTYEERLLFKNLFPIFYIDTRNLDITEWGYVWEILGDLAKVSNAERKNVKEEINAILLNSSHETSKKLKIIKEIFNSANVNIKSATAKEYATILTKVFFSGQNIQKLGKHLNYYSAGTNSVQYIELLLKSIDALSRVKMKEPIILFDEPEIGLHSSYIDELSDSITNVNSKLNILINTHSSRLTKNLITTSKNTSIYNVKLINKYSVITKMKKFSQYSPTSKYRVADDHINSYFSKATLFVEGETELELFSNPYLRILFPKLKMIDVFKAISDKPILDIMNPNLSNSQVPYLCLIDMDKVISYDILKKTFILKNEYLPENKKERFRYRNKKELAPYLYFQRQRVDAMYKKLHVHYILPFLSCNDPNYYAFLSAIKQYLLFYNIYTLNTTIEGVLINNSNYDFAFEFLKIQNNQKDFRDFTSYWNTLYKNDKVNLLRILYNGKSDLLKSRKNILNFLDVKTKLILDKITIGGKASGWVSKYLDTFFQSASKINGEFSEKNFIKYLENNDNKKNMLYIFQNKFFELYSLIETLCDIIKL